MALYDNRCEGRERNKLESLKTQLEQLNKDKERLEAAIRFLEANPDAIALVNSL
jgi:cell division protein FtsB